MNGADVEKVYRQCLKREIDRERMWRKSKRCGNIRNSVHILDFEAAEAAEDSPSWISDGGKGVEDIIDACDRAAPGAEGTEAPLDCGCEPNRRRRDILRNARKRLKRAHPELLEVFNLIVKNGKNRKESIWALMNSRKRRNGTPQRCCTGAT